MPIRYFIDKTSIIFDCDTIMMHLEDNLGNPLSEKEIKAQLVLIAAGFLGSESYVTEAFGVERNQRTNVATKEGEYQTSKEKIFTAGDMHRGQSLVVWAIAEGRAVAKAVDESLMGYTW